MDACYVSNSALFKIQTHIPNISIVFYGQKQKVDKRRKGQMNEWINFMYLKHQHQCTVDDPTWPQQLWWIVYKTVWYIHEGCRYIYNLSYCEVNSSLAVHATPEGVCHSLTKHLCSYVEMSVTVCQFPSHCVFQCQTLCNSSRLDRPAPLPPLSDHLPPPVVLHLLCEVRPTGWLNSPLLVLLGSVLLIPPSISHLSSVPVLVHPHPPLFLQPSMSTN